MKMFLVIFFLIFSFCISGINTTLASCSGLPGCIEPTLNPPITIDCPTAKENLEKFISSLPNVCKSDSDCETLYIRADSCAAPAVIQKGSITEKNEPLLISLQESIRQSCAQDQQKTSPCEAILVPFICKNSKCIDARTDGSN